MKKLFLAAAILFAVPFSSFAFSVGIDQVVAPCGAQSVTVTGTADYSDGQYGPVQSASLVISGDYSPVKVVTVQSPTWSATIPVKNGSAIVDAKIVSSHDGIDFQAGTLVTASKPITVPACPIVETKYIPSNAVVPALLKPATKAPAPIPQPQVVLTQANRALVIQLIKLLQSLIGQ